MAADRSQRYGKRSGKRATTGAEMTGEVDLNRPVWPACTILPGREEERQLRGRPRSGPAGVGRSRMSRRGNREPRVLRRVCGRGTSRRGGIGQCRGHRAGPADPGERAAGGNSSTKPRVRKSPTSTNDCQACWRTAEGLRGGQGSLSSAGDLRETGPIWPIRNWQALNSTSHAR